MNNLRRRLTDLVVGAVIGSLTYGAISWTVAPKVFYYVTVQDGKMVEIHDGRLSREYYRLWEQDSNAGERPEVIVIHAEAD